MESGAVDLGKPGTDALRLAAAQLRGQQQPKEHTQHCVHCLLPSMALVERLGSLGPPSVDCVIAGKGISFVGYSLYKPGCAFYIRTDRE